METNKLLTLEEIQDISDDFSRGLMLTTYEQKSLRLLPSLRIKN
jgi:hypothetical protein